MFREVLMKITEACPCRCAFCDAHDKYANYHNFEIDDGKWMDCCKDLVLSGVEIVIISGGEALVRAELVYRMIDYLKSNNVFVVLNTSGALFSLVRYFIVQKYWMN